MQYPPSVGTGNSTVYVLLNGRINSESLTKPAKLPGPDAIYFDHVESVVYGHFLSPKSEDAAVSGGNGETHPSFWGGTLLLTKSAGRWNPVWYKGAVITRKCRKVSLATGRDILICEEQDGGMGHSYHIVYALDLLSPRNPWDAALLVTDSYKLMCSDRQEQSIEAIDFQSASEIRFSLRNGRKKLSGRERQSCADGIATSPPVTKKFNITFVLRGERFEVADTSEKTLELFRLR